MQLSERLKCALIELWNGTRVQATVMDVLHDTYHYSATKEQDHQPEYEKEYPVLWINCNPHASQRIGPSSSADGKR